MSTQVKPSHFTLFIITKTSDKPEGTTDFSIPVSQALPVNRQPPD